jgi:hypothetical protein
MSGMQTLADAAWPSTPARSAVSVLGVEAQPRGKGQVNLHPFGDL